MTPASARSPTRVHLRHFSKSLPMSLLRAREAVMRHFRPSLRRHGLTEQQWRVLRALATVPDIEVAGLARATFLLGPSLSRILQDLEGRGLIRRAASPGDLRRGVISITAAGAALIETVTPSSEAIYRAITQRFGAEKLAALQALLRELEEAVADLDTALPDDEPQAALPHAGKAVR
ncbi:homoprotocatechuate degradation operon regulator HpaR [Enterovirga aerilata]|uniref:Homoprotocatechuate degradation operon regulator HpaR n=1 Tax=Enterovirga aerilata TaxID=2730920 RepID=A0A849I472_9HYPH|nr:homoprotocatechuate degradation operon regulator HpaR [Enterovirga sp. DB1703]NNM71179.1 homoprotocatechuate degradation operon regulator HpaR [Enterovirga sp. DB1703]